MGRQQEVLWYTNKNMKVALRPMSENDAEDVSRLSMQLGYPISVEETRLSISAVCNSVNDIGIVALYENRIMGWMQLTKTLRIESGTFGEITGLVVDEQHRGAGIGRQLIDFARSWCNENGYKALVVRCNIKREQSHKFYLSTGFKQTKEQKIFRLDM